MGFLPIILHAVEEAVAAGITDPIFVTGRTKSAIEDHFDANLELKRALREKGKDEVANMVRDTVPNELRCIFLRQAEVLRFGSVLLCTEPVKGVNPSSF